LVIPPDCKEEKITIKAVLKTNASVWIERTLWIKRKPDPEHLPTKEEILNDKPKRINHRD
jgi:hypothetical protein